MQEKRRQAEAKEKKLQEEAERAAKDAAALKLKQESEVQVCVLLEVRRATRRFL